VTRLIFKPGSFTKLIVKLWWS